MSAGKGARQEKGPGSRTGKGATGKGAQEKQEKGPGSNFPEARISPQTTALDVMERLIEAAYSRDKAAILATANLGLEKLRFLFRLALDLRCTDMRRYEFAARAIDEIGRLVGGWLRVGRTEAIA